MSVTAIRQGGPRRRSRRRWRVPAMVAGAAWLAAAGARAADLTAAGDLPTETLASSERKKDFDVHKRYGAATVGERAVPQPEGIRVGNFVFYPSVGSLVRYDDNIFATSTNRTRDVIGELTPTLRIRSSLPRHELNLALSGRFVQYLENDDQSYADVTGSATAAAHLDHAHTLAASVLSSLRHEEVLDPGRPLAAHTPVEFGYHRATVGITRDAGRLYGTLSATGASWDYKDARGASGEVIDQDTRDAELLRTQLFLGYRFSPGYDLRARVAAIRTWNESVPEMSLSSMGYEAMIGLRGELNPLFRWELLGGYATRDFERAGVATIASYIYEGNLTWLAMERLTLKARLGRSLAEPVDSDGSGRIDTHLGGRAEVELWHNLFLNVDAEMRQSDFYGIDRQDRTLSGKISLDYHLTENWLFTLSYDYQHRQSTLSDADMDRNRFSIGAKLRF